MKGKRLISLILVLCMVLGMVPITAGAAEADGWYWDGSTLYIKDGSITKGNLYNALVEKYGSGSYKYADSKPSYGWDTGGTDVTSDNTSSISFTDSQSVTVGKKGSTSYKDWTGWGSNSTTQTFTVKHYYEPSVTFTTDTQKTVNVVGLADKVINGNDIVFNLTGVGDTGYVATVSNGVYSQTVTLDKSSATSVTVENITSADAAKITIKIQKATFYTVTLNNTTPDYGTASVSATSGIAGTVVTVTATPNQATGSASFALESIKVNGSSITGNTFTITSQNVTVEVTFSKKELAGNSSATVPFNGAYNGAATMTPAELAALKTAIFNAVVKPNDSIPSGVACENVTIQYYQYHVSSNPLEENGFNKGLKSLGAAATADDSDKISHTYYDFGERAYNSGNAIKTDNNNNIEKVRIIGNTGTSWAGLYVEADITLTEGRQVVTITPSDTIPTATVTNSEDPILSAVQAATTISSGNVTVTPVWSRVSGTLPTATTKTTESYVYKVSVDATAENLAAEATIDAQAVLAQYTISWDTDADGDVDYTTDVYYNVTPTAPTATEKDGYSATWPKLAPATADVTYAVEYSKDDVYTVSFVTNIQGYNIDSQTYNVTKQPTITVTAPTVNDQPNKIFDGWYADAEFKNAYTFETTPTASITLYAKWVDDTHDNNVRDENETVTVKINTDNCGGTVTIDGTTVENGDSYIFNSTKENTVVVTPGSPDDGATGYIDSCSLSGGTYDGGVYTVSTNLTDGAEISVVFARKKLTGSKEADIKFNPKKTDEAQLDALKQELFTKLNVKHYLNGTDTDLAWNTSGVTYEYYQYHNTSIGDGFNAGTKLLGEAANTDDTSGNWHIYYDFGERYSSGGSAAEKIRISYNGLSIEADVTLVEGRDKATITYTKPDRFEYENESEIIAKLTTKNNNVVATNSSKDITATRVTENLPSSGKEATLTYKLAVAEDENYLANEITVEIDVKAKSNPAVINLTVKGAGSANIGGTSGVSTTGDVTAENGVTVNGSLTTNDYTLTATPTGNYYVESVKITETKIVDDESQSTSSELDVATLTKYGTNRAWSQTVAIANDTTYDIVVTFAERTLTAKENPAIDYNFYNKVSGSVDAVKTELIEDVLVATGGTPTADKLTVSVYNNTTHLWYDITDGLGNLADETFNASSEQLRIVWAGDARYPQLTLETTVTVNESRPKPVITAAETLSISSDSTVNADAIKTALKDADATYVSGEETVSVWNDVVVTLPDSYEFPADGARVTVDVTLSLAANANHLAADNKTVNVTITNPGYPDKITVSKTNCAVTIFADSNDNGVFDNPEDNDDTDTDDTVFTSYNSVPGGTYFAVVQLNDGYEFGTDDGVTLKKGSNDAVALTGTDGVYKFTIDYLKGPDDLQVGYTLTAEATKEIKYTVKLVLDSSQDYTTYDTVDGKTDSAAITYGATVTLPDGERLGYDFSGWYTDSGCTEGNKCGETITVTKEIIGDNNTITLYGKWTLASYDLIFDIGDDAKWNDTVVEQSGEVEYLSPITAPTQDPTRDGYTFAGWDKEIPTTMPAEDVTITAKWTINQYTITFDTDGGTAIDPITQNYGTAVTAPANPTKTGYTFAGWDAEIPATMPAEDVTITAKWNVNQYTIYFKNGDDVVASVLGDYGSAVNFTPTAPTRDGYTFAGWDTEIPTTMPAGDVYITAKWTINQYTITYYDSDVDSTVLKIDTYDYGAAITAYKPESRTGYTFAGWLETKENGELVSATVPANMPAENLQYTAKWEQGTFSVTWNVDGNTNTTTTAFGNNIVLPATPTKEGWTFAGWKVGTGDSAVVHTESWAMPAENITAVATWTINKYKAIWDVDGVKTEVEYEYNTTITAPAAPEKTGYTFTGWNGFTTGMKMGDANVTFTAQWSINSYDLKYVIGNDAQWKDSAIQEESKIQYNAAITQPVDPEKTGYTFGGWYTDDKFETAFSFTNATMPDQDVTLYAKWDVNSYTVTWVDKDNETIDTETVAYGGSTTKTPGVPAQTGYTGSWNHDGKNITGDTIINAVYVVNLYTITFNTDGGSEVAAITQDYGTAVTAPANPTKEGYSFKGWDKAIPTTMPAENVTITAQWIINQYTIKFVTNGGTEVADITADYGAAVAAPTEPTRDLYQFAGWYTDTACTDESKVTFPYSMPEEGITLYASWTAKNDTNENGVPDENETIKVVINGHGTVKVGTSDANTYTNSEGGSKEFSFVYNSVNNGTVISRDITATPTDTDGSDGSADYVKSVKLDEKELSGSYSNYVYTASSVSLTNGCTIYVEFAERTLEARAGTVWVNKYYTATATMNAAEAFKTLRTDLLAAAGLDPYEDYVITTVVGVQSYNITATIEVYNGSVNIVKPSGYERLNGVAAGVLCSELNDKTAYSFTITKPADEKGPEISKTVSMSVLDSRKTLAITAENLSITADAAPNDIAQQVKGNIKITATDPKTGVAEIMPVQDSYLSYEPSYGWPDDGGEKTFTITVNVNQAADATYSNAPSATMTLTCKDTTALYTVVYTDGVAEKEVFTDQTYTVADGKAPTAFDGTPTRQYYTFDGWSPEVHNAVSSEVADKDGIITYTATWSPIKDADNDGVADEEDTFKITWNAGEGTFKSFDSEKGETAQKRYTEVAYGNVPVAFEGTDLTPPENKSFGGWNPELSTVTANAEYTAVYTADTVYTITYKLSENEGYRTQTINVTQNPNQKITAVANPDANYADNKVFGGWTNSNLIGTVPTSDVTLMAIWHDDFNNNEVADTEETATITINKTGNGTVKLSESFDKTTVKENENGTYTVLFDSATEGANVITVTATADDTGKTDSKNALTAFTINNQSVSSPATISAQNGYSYTVNATFTNTTLNAKNGTIYVNGYSAETKAAGLKDKILTAVLGAGYTDNYKVYLYSKITTIEKFWDVEGETVTSLSIPVSAETVALMLSPGATERIKIEDKTTGLTKEVQVAVKDSRGILTINTENLNIEAAAEPSDVEAQVKTKISITCDDPATAEVETTPVDLSKATIDKGGYKWPEDGQKKTFTVTVSIATNGNETYQACESKTLTLTCKDTTALYTVTYTDGVDGEELFADQTSTVAENAAAPAFNGPPTRTNYTFTGWSDGTITYGKDETLPAVTGNVTYTAQWAITNDDNENGVPDEEDVFTVKFVRINDDDSQEVLEIRTELKVGNTVSYAPTYVQSPVGKYFAGWDKCISGDIDTVEVKAEYDTDGDRVITFVAQWSDQCVVTFDYNGNGKDNDTVYVTPNTTVEKPKSDPTWAKHLFLGWYFGETEYDFTKAIVGNIIITAKWADDKNNNSIIDGSDEDPYHTYTWVDGNNQTHTEQYLPGVGNDDDTGADSGESSTDPGFTYVEQPNDGQTFVRWEVSAGSENTYVAVFAPDKNDNEHDDGNETVAVEKLEGSVGDGSVDVPNSVITEGNIIYNSRADVTVTITPAIGCYIEKAYIVKTPAASEAAVVSNSTDDTITGSFDGTAWRATIPANSGCVTIYVKYGTRTIGGSNGTIEVNGSDYDSKVQSLTKKAVLEKVLGRIVSDEEEANYTVKMLVSLQSVVDMIKSIPLIGGYLGNLPSELYVDIWNPESVLDDLNLTSVFEIEIFQSYKDNVVDVIKNTIDDTISVPGTEKFRITLQADGNMPEVTEYYTLTLVEARITATLSLDVTQYYASDFDESLLEEVKANVKCNPVNVVIGDIDFVESSLPAAFVVGETYEVKVIVSYDGTADYLGGESTFEISVKIGNPKITIPYDPQNPIVMNYNTGMSKTGAELGEMIIGALDGVGAGIDYVPDELEGKPTSVKYLAREAGKVPLRVKYSGMAGYLNIDETIEIEVVERWLKVGEEIPEIKDSIGVDDITPIVENLINNYLSDLGSLGGLVSGGMDGLKVELLEMLKTELQKNSDLSAYITYLGAHEFGASNKVDEDGNALETVKLTQTGQDNGYGAVESNTSVLTLKDTRTKTEIKVNGTVTMTYKPASEAKAAEAELIEKLKDVVEVYTEDDAKYITNEVEIVTDIAGMPVTEGTTITVRYPGDAENYRDCTAEVTLIVEKAAVSVSVESQTVKYGQQYNKTPVTTDPAGVETIKFLVGLDISELDMEGTQIKGIMGSVQLFLPKTLQDLMSSLEGILKLLGVEMDLSDGATLRLSELLNLADILESDLVGGMIQGSEYADALGTLLSIINSLPTDMADIEITIGGEMPTDVGVYLMGAVTANANYETAANVGYLIIYPDGKKVELDWALPVENYMVPVTVIKDGSFDLGAYVTEAYEGSAEEADELVVELFVGYDVLNQKVILETDQTKLPIGAYAEAALIHDFGNEMYYAVPIARAFVVIAETVDVELTGQNEVVYDGSSHGLEATVDGGVQPYGTLEVRYIGASTNLQIHNSEEEPTNAGIYTVIATYVENDENGEVARFGMDVELLTIRLNRSAAIEVSTEVMPYESGMSYDIGNMVTVSDEVENDDASYTLITGMIEATDGFFANNADSFNGLAGIEGTVNVDFPEALDNILKDVEYFKPAYDGEGIEMSGVLDKIAEYKDTILMLGISEETYNKLMHTLGQISENVHMTCNDNAVADTVGVYVVVGIITDTDYLPAMDAGLLVIHPDVTQNYLKFNYEDDNNIFGRDIIDAMAADDTDMLDLEASAYLDEEYSQLNEEATAKVVDKFITIDREGNITITEDWEKLTTGVYVQTSYIPLALGTEMEVSDLIVRPVIVVPHTVDMVFVGGSEQTVTYNGNNHTMAVEITDDYGNMVIPEDGKLSIRYLGLVSNISVYNSTEGPVHPGVYAVVATYFDKENEAVGACVGTLTIKPGAATIEIAVNDTADDYEVVVEIDEGINDADGAEYLLMTAGLEFGSGSDGASLAGAVDLNVDFPARVDNLIKKLFKVDQISDISITKDQFVQLADTLTELLAKIGYENDYIDKIMSLLDQVDGTVTITFNDGFKPVDSGMYVIVGVVFDPDYEIAMAMGTLSIGEGEEDNKPGDGEENEGEYTVTIVLGDNLTKHDSTSLTVKYDEENRTLTQTVKNSADIKAVAVKAVSGHSIPKDYVSKIPGIVENKISGLVVTRNVSLAGVRLIVEPDPDAEITSDVTLRLPGVYTVTFNTFGYGETPAIQNVVENYKATNPGELSANGMAFGGWYIDASCTTKYEFDKPVTADIVLHAKWTKNEPETAVTYYDVQVYAKPSYAGEVDCGGQYEEGKSVTVTAKANEGYEFVAWTESGEQVSDNPTYSFTATKDRTLIAVFDDETTETVDTYDVTVSADPEEGGTVSGGRVYPANAAVTVTATANEGYEFVAWTESGEQVSDEAEYSFTATGPRALVAKFKAVTVQPEVTYCTVTFNANGHGTAPEVQTVESGKKATEPKEPSEYGWEFGGWYTEENCVNKFDFDTPITENIELFAKWTEIEADPDNPGGDNPSVDPDNPGEEPVVPDDPKPEPEIPDIDLDDLMSGIRDFGSSFDGISLGGATMMPGIGFGTSFDTMLGVYQTQLPDIWFIDVQSTAWYYNSVVSLAYQGIINGYPDGSFRPQGEVTWGEALKLVMKAVGYADQPAIDDHWASGYMTKAIEDKLIDGEVELNSAITRAEVGDLAAKALKLPPATIANPFDDVAPASALALYEADIIKGSLDNGKLLYRSESTITRAEIAEIIWRVYKAK